MPSRRALHLTLATLVGGFGVWREIAAQPAPLLWVSGEVPPYLWRGAKGPQGYAFELFERVVKQANLNVELQFFPWARALLMVQGGLAQAALVMARTPDRESQFRWLFPVGNFQLCIVTRAGDGPPLRTLDALKGLRVGALRASASRAMLAAAGLTSIVEGKDYTDLLTLLMRGIVDVVIGPEAVLRTLAGRQTSGPDALRATVLDVSRDLYAAGGPAMSEAEQLRFMGAYQQLVDSGFVAQLKKRHPDAFFDD